MDKSADSGANASHKPKSESLMAVQQRQATNPSDHVFGVPYIANGAPNSGGPSAGAGSSAVAGTTEGTTTGTTTGATEGITTSSTEGTEANQNTSANEGTSASANEGANEGTGAGANTNKGTTTSTNEGATITTNANENTSTNANANENTSTNASTNANKGTNANTNASANANKSANPSTNVSEGTNANQNTSTNEGTANENTSTSAKEGTSTNASTQSTTSTTAGTSVTTENQSKAHPSTPSKSSKPIQKINLPLRRSARQERALNVPQQRNEYESILDADTLATAKIRAQNLKKKRKNKKDKPSKMVKLVYKNKQPLPHLEPIVLDQEAAVFWMRVNIREFLFRFDKLCRLPTRYFGLVNDPSICWTDQLYKAVIVALLRLIENDNVPIVKNVHHYKVSVKETAADSPGLWQILLEFLQSVDPNVNKADKVSGEMYRLELVRRLMVVTTGTATIRLTVVDDHDQLQHLHTDFSSSTKTYKANWTAQQTKLQNLKKVDKQRYREKIEAGEQQLADRIFREEQVMFHQTRKYNLRTAPLGSDNAKNVYWALQMRNKDASEWGSWIICKMKTAIECEEEPVQDGEYKLFAAKDTETQQALASWIRGQPGDNKTQLAEEIESRARFRYASA